MLIHRIQKGRVTSLALNESLSDPQELATTHFSCLLAALEQQQHLQYTSTETNKRDRSTKYGYTTSIVRGIESVELSDHFLKSITSTSSLVVLLMYISKLPNLRKLRIYSVYIAWPVMIWSRVLQTAVRLESWHVTRGIRLTNADDIEVLADCLRNHPSLVEVSLLDLGDVDVLWNHHIQRRNRDLNMYETIADNDTDNEEENNTQNILANDIISTERPSQNDYDTTENDSSSTPKMTLDPLVLALSTIPNLATVDITVAPEFAPKLGRLSDASLQSLFCLPCLLDVSLWEFGLDNEHMAVLKEAVQSHRRLQFLSLRRNPGITCAGWKTVSDMMEQNTTLVSLYYDDSASASTIADSEQRRLLTSHHDRIRLFLWLNQLGRGDMLDSLNTVHDQHDNAVANIANITQVQQCNDKAWLTFLDRVSGDPDAVLYLLQANPQLCCGQGLRPDKTRQQVISTIPSNKPSTEYQHAGEQLSLNSLFQSRTMRNNGVAAAYGNTTGTELVSNHQEQFSEESRRLFFISTLTQALELSEDVMDSEHFCEERHS
jgi:hypothetical protein